MQVIGPVFSTYRWKGRVETAEDKADAAAQARREELRAQLQEYLDMATKDCLARKAGHEPQLLDRVFKMQVNLAKNGTMKIDNWDL